MFAGRRIGISLRVVPAARYHEPRDAVSHDWLRLLDGWGLMPVLLPNVLENFIEYVNSSNLDGILLTNGDDVSPTTYSEAEDDSVSYSSVRDTNELSLIDWALQNEVPLLGVCRGLHVINIFFGGSVSQNLESISGEGMNHVATNHGLKIIDDKFGPLFGTEAEVNSYHRHGVMINDLSSKLLPFAVTEDKTVEGLYHPQQNIVGIQWHPERPGPNNPYQQEVAKVFLTEGKLW